MNELVKEIEEAESYLHGSLLRAQGPSGTPTIGVDAAHKLLSTLQRAREALSWTSVEERLPGDETEYLCECEGAYVGEMSYYKGWYLPDVKRWALLIDGVQGFADTDFKNEYRVVRYSSLPYTPEEK